jgi:hypothetical protein
MILPIPSTPSPASSDDNSNPPRTPISPNMQSLPLSDQSKLTTAPATNPNGATQMKRKPSRRANTAERRATHNAVERQRRETLNGRFLDLAALLPNLSQIRRPSKSSIVNSSIAHIHASRRHRILAARELRLIKLESDALRRELNEWRDRAGLPRVEEPIRGDGFAMVLSGELEVLSSLPEEEEEQNGPSYDGYDDMDDDFAPTMGNSMEDMDDPRNAMANNFALLKNANTNPFAYNVPPANNMGNGHLPNIIPRSSQGPMIATNPTAVSFENPAMTSLYEPNTHHGSQYPSTQYLQQQSSFVGLSDTDKVAAWNAQLYSVLANGTSPQHQQQLMHAQRALFTPPSSSHSLSTASTPSTTNVPVPINMQSNTFSESANQAFLANFQRQQQISAIQQQQQGGHLYLSPDGDDSSSVGSVKRERSGSLSGSGYGSPPQGSPSGGFEVPNAAPLVGANDFGVPRRMNSGSHVGNGPWGCDVDSINAMGMMKSSLGSPIAVGGGGNGTGFANMM